MKCKKCEQTVNALVIHDLELWCWPCHNEVKFANVVGSSAGIIPDEIPGGVEIKHGICNEDGTPRRFYSKSAIRQAAWEAGYFQGEDTPKSNPRIAEQRAREKEQRFAARFRSH